MTNKDLIKYVWNKNPDFTQDKIQKIIHFLFKRIQFLLANRERIEFRGFGIFDTKIVESHKARNPRSGTSVQTEKKLMIKFKPSRNINERINEIKKTREKNNELAI